MPTTEFVQSTASITVDLLDAITAFANLLIAAENSGKISFDDQVASTAMSIVSKLMDQASKMKPDELETLLKHIREDGPDVAESMINEIVLTKTPPIMDSRYLIEVLIKPPSPIGRR